MNTNYDINDNANNFANNYEILSNNNNLQKKDYKYSQFDLTSSYAGFIFVIFVIIAGGEVGASDLSCRMRKLLHSNIYFRHIINYMLIFIFIMLEGGWSFNLKQQYLYEQDSVWLDGNIIHSLFFALILYFIFVISSRTRIFMNILFYLILFSLYCLNAQRLYWYKRKLITENQNQKYIIFQKTLILLMFIILVSGIIDLFIDKLIEKGDEFDIIKFIFGKRDCGIFSVLKKVRK